MKDEAIINQSPPIATSSLLVVDDNSMNRIMLSRYITKIGYRSSLAENGQQSLEKLQTGLCNLVLLDVGMPGMDGYQVDELRNRARADEEDGMQDKTATEMDGQA